VLLGDPALADEPDFKTNAGRVTHRDRLIPRMLPLTQKFARDDLLKKLEAAGVPGGPINDLADVFADPHVQARGMTIDVPHPLAGSVRLVSSPMKLSVTPVRLDRAPPLLGADTEPVLAEFGLDAEAIAGLKRAGAI
jgi:crotonobetainyl-CoA:carnitine CoA-transferase CaiB-like acyl-CoA transferase